MINQTGYRILITASVALLICSCVTRKYQQPGLPAGGGIYRDTAITVHDSLSLQDTSSIAEIPYTRFFSDTKLQALIREGISQNLNLKIAMERINEAFASLRQSRSAFLPGLDANAGVTFGKQSAASLNLPSNLIGTFPLTTTSYQLGLSSSWEVDIWGKLKSAKRAAIANWLASDASRRAVQTQLVANIAGYYYQLLSFDEQLAITEETLKTRMQEVETMKSLKESAIVTGAAVVQSEANRYAAEVLLPDLRQNIREIENALSTLLGRPAGPIARNSLSDQAAYRDLQTGVPSLLLKNRPDVQQAELSFRAAFENTNVARTYFYPQLTLTAQGGVSSFEIKDLFNMSVFYNVITGLTEPVFSKGLNKARLKIAKAQQQEAFYNYQQTMLTAGEEVSNALYAYQTALEKQSSRGHQIDALVKAVDFTKQLLEYSSATNYTDVLTSEQALLSAQLSSVSDRLQQLLATVDLYRALGGGWRE